MAMDPLSKKQTKKLLEHVKNVISYINNIKEEDDMVKESIKNIQVPVRLSESMALNFLKEGKIKINNATDKNRFAFGEKRNSYDIEYTFKDKSKKINIEVKATGTNEFQRFRKHAMKSDKTIWIDFYGLRKTDPTSKYNIYIFETDKVFRKFKSKNEKEITIDKLKKEYQIKPI